MIADVRFAVRQVRRSPGFALAAIVTLALGIGATTSAYSVARGLLWRPLPFPDPDRIVVLHGANPSRGITDAEVSYADLADLRDQSATLAGLAALAQRQAALGTPDGADRVTGWRVDPSLFGIIGMPALLGRTFRPDEGGAEAAPVAVLSHGFWTRRFGRDSSVVGRVVPIDGVGHTVVGVMPPDFRFVRGDLFRPLAADPAMTRDERYFLAVGRLRVGASVAGARAELAAAAARLETAHPATNRGWGIELNRYRDDIVDADGRQGLLLMLGAVGMVLLIACANVAGLMMARAATRGRELAVRAAVGASRTRLVRQVMAEGAVLAAAGAGLGVAMAVWWTDLLFRTLPGEDIPAWLRTSLDGPTLAVTAGASVASLFVFALLPALRASRPSVVETLKGGMGATAGTRGRAALVVGQVALAMVLVATAALFSQSFIALRRSTLGFDDRRVLSARVFFGALPDRPARTAWMRAALADVAAVPGVTAVALTGAVPGDDGGDHRALAVEGAEVLPGEEPIVTVVPSSAGLPDVLGVAPLAGRWFTEAEAADQRAAVAVVGATLARRLWPDGAAVGRRIRALPDTAWLTVVGVLGNLQYEEFGEDGEADRLQVHVPFGREPWRSAALLVRSGPASAALVEPVRRAARATHRSVPIFDAMTMRDTRRYTTAGDRVWVLIYGSLGALALLLAAVGLYGLLAFSVAQRRREIGVRMALGADAAGVVRLVVGRSVLLAALGVAIGLGAGAAVVRLLRSGLYGVTGSTQPLVVAAGVLLATSLAAAFWPARRAAATDPAVALRAE